MRYPETETEGWLRLPLGWYAGYDQAEPRLRSGAPELRPSSARIESRCSPVASPAPARDDPAPVAPDRRRIDASTGQSPSRASRRLGAGDGSSWRGGPCRPGLAPQALRGKGTARRP